MLASQLVLINVSDHHTRTRANTPGAAPSSGVKVLGALLGSQSGRTIDISNSFEVKFDVVDGALAIDNPFLVKKQAQCEARGLHMRPCTASRAMLHDTLHGRNPIGISRVA